MGWRVFIGQWEDDNPERDWYHYDVTFATWAEARDFLRPKIAPEVDYWRQNGCGGCEAEAQKGVDALGTPETPFAINIDGEDYMLIAVSGPDGTTNTQAGDHA